MTVPNAEEWASQDDAALVAQARDNPAAFGVLYERYVQKVYNYIYYRTGSHEDAEDLTARVFHRAMAHIKGYVERGVPFQAWLYRIAHNLVANWHRDRSRHKVVPLDEFVAARLRGEALEASAESQDEIERLVQAVRTLPEERQQLLILKFVDRLSNQEIGAIMDRSEGAIKSLYHRTLLALREMLGGVEEQAQAEKPRREKRR
ncbi:MAG: sigma-70 family RNA polymerase sigma factor [Aggregatilineales bacterium]